MTVSFSIPSPPREWSQFPLGEWLASVFPWWPEGFMPVIHVYAIIIIIGIIAAVLLTNARLTRRGAEPWIIIDIAVWAVLFGIVGSRVYHVLTHPGDYFAPEILEADPFAWIRVWDGGVAIFGALIGGGIGVVIASRIIGMRFLSIADAAAPGILLAQALGRIGNYFNQELFGQPTDLPWGLEIDRPNAAIPVGLPADTLFHPTFLYESMWNIAGVVILLLVDARARTLTGAKLGQRSNNWQWGKLFGLYLVWYGIGRTFTESIRLDQSESWLGIRVNVWGAIAAIVIGLVIIIYQSKNHPGLEPSVYRPGREWDGAAGLESDDTYSEFDDIEYEGQVLATSKAAT